MNYNIDIDEMAEKWKRMSEVAEYSSAFFENLAWEKRLSLYEILMFSYKRY